MFQNQTREDNAVRKIKNPLLNKVLELARKGKNADQIAKQLYNNGRESAEVVGDAIVEAQKMGKLRKANTTKIEDSVSIEVDGNKIITHIKVWFSSAKVGDLKKSIDQAVNKTFSTIKDLSDTFRLTINSVQAVPIRSGGLEIVSVATIPHGENVALGDITGGIRRAFENQMIASELENVAGLVASHARYLDPAKLFKSLSGKSFVFFDTETTGLSPTNSQVTEIAAIAVGGPKMRISAKMHKKVTLKPETVEKIMMERLESKHPGKTVDELLEMTRYHTLEAPEGSEEDVFQEFKEFCAKHAGIIVAHNAEFDMKMVGHKVGKIPNSGVIDTMQFARLYFIPALKVLAASGDPEAQAAMQAMMVKGRPSASLGSIAKALGINVGGWHRAIDDVLSTVEVFKGVIDHFDKRGDITSDPKFREEQENIYLWQRGFKEDKREIAKLMGAIKNAKKSGRSLEFLYRKNDGTERKVKVKPEKVDKIKGGVMLIGYDLNRNAERNFKSTNIVRGTVRVV